MNNHDSRRVWPRSLKLLWLCSAILLLTARPDQACTVAAFSEQGQLFFAANYDFAYEQGLLFVNPRGLQKSNLRDVESDRIDWQARYGSVTLNQFGRELPTGGMNEAGLAIELLWQDDAVYPPPAERGNLNELQWIQYQLDLSATVSDAIAAARRVGIRRVVLPVHYFLCDRSAACAIIEFVDGRMTVFSGAALPRRALANTSYAVSLAYAERAESRGELPDDIYDHRQRFAIAFHQSQGNAQLAPLDRAYATLRAVSAQPRWRDLLAWIFHGTAPGFTQWSIVYQPQAGRISLRTRSNAQLRWIDLSQLQFACRAGARTIDINSGAGDLRPLLHPAGAEQNAALIRQSYAPIADQFPPEVQQALAAYPESFRCP